MQAAVHQIMPPHHDSYVDILTPTLTMCGDRTYKEVIKVNKYKGVGPWLSEAISPPPPHGKEEAACQKEERRELSPDTDMPAPWCHTSIL